MGFSRLQKGVSAALLKRPLQQDRRQHFKAGGAARGLEMLEIDRDQFFVRAVVQRLAGFLAATVRVLDRDDLFVQVVVGLPEHRGRLAFGREGLLTIKGTGFQVLDDRLGAFNHGVLGDADSTPENQCISVAIAGLHARHTQLGVDVEQRLDFVPGVLLDYRSAHGVRGFLVRLQEHDRQVADSRKRTQQADRRGTRAARLDAFLVLAAYQAPQVADQSGLTCAGIARQFQKGPPLLHCPDLLGEQAAGPPGQAGHPVQTEYALEVVEPGRVERLATVHWETASGCLQTLPLDVEITVIVHLHGLAYGYLDILRQYADELRPTANRPNAETRSFELSTAQCVNKIYQANLGRLGGLSESEATLIVRFHFMLEGFLLATVAGGDLAEGARYHVIQKAVDLLEEIVETADRLAEKPAPWWSRGGHNVDAGKREKEVMSKD